MDKLPCEVVRDLLPSYVDGLTSETTNRLVDEHIETCEPCRTALSAMRTPEPSAPDGGAEKEIDFLRKNKSKNRAVLLWSLAAAVFVVAAVLLTRAFVIGEPLSGRVTLSDVEVNGNVLSVELSTMDSACVVKGINFTESEGVVTVSARTVLVGLQRRNGCFAEYTASEPIRQVCMSDRILWDDGVNISRQVSDVYQTRHDYVGDMPANNRTANMLGISHYLGAYQNELLTARQPYVWKFLLQEDVPESRRALREREMESFGYVLLAMVGNLEEVRYEYAVDGTAAKKSLTVEDATAFFGQNIKACGDSPRLLAELMRKTDLENYGLDIAEHIARSGSVDIFWIEVVNFTDEDITFIELAISQDGELCSTHGASNADNSPIGKGEKLSFDLYPEDLRGSWETVGELTVQFAFATTDGTRYEISGPLRLAPSSGGIVRVTINGNAAEGFTITQ